MSAWFMVLLFWTFSGALELLRLHDVGCGVDAGGVSLRI